MYTIEINITGINEKLVKIMAGIATNNGFDVMEHGKDHLVFTSDRGDRFTKMINELSRACELYGIDYVDLLV